MILNMCLFIYFSMFQKVASCLIIGFERFFTCSGIKFPISFFNTFWECGGLLQPQGWPVTKVEGHRLRGDWIICDSRVQDTAFPCGDRYASTKETRSHGTQTEEPRSRQSHRLRGRLCPWVTEEVKFAVRVCRQDEDVWTEDLGRGQFSVWFLLKMWSHLYSRWA